jgi:Cu-Zn family superoxide dismutase
MRSSCAPYVGCKGGGLQAVSVLVSKDNSVNGTVIFTETKNGLKIEYEINGLSDGKHGFHIHECGDLTDGCKSACAHFNPYNKKHGGIDSSERHAGDLGNVISKDGKSQGILIAKVLSLKFTHRACIIGRMCLIHKDEDDLGLGGDAESLITGNAGERVACGVIGIKKFGV